MKKNIKIALFSCLVMLLPLFMPETVEAYTFYQEIESEQLMPGVRYETRKRVTGNGLLDIHIVRVDMTAKNVKIDTITDKTIAKKAKTSAIANQHGAIAAVNGDFFGMKGTYSGPLGLAVSNGVPSVSDTYNKDKIESGTFYIDSNNQPFIDYFKTNISLMVDYDHVLPLGAINKAFNINYPIAITSGFAKNTQDIDNRYKSRKVVVNNEKITYISKLGETVDIPDNGFVVIIKEGHDFPDTVSVGQQSKLYIDTTIDLKNIETAMSGSNKILDKGGKTKGTYVPGGRQPRTAIGISKDKKEVIMVVVDGRTHSIGATHDKMGDIMKQLGAYDAVHLDGGGSSTMVIRREDEDWASVVNTVSDKYERNVANALGVFNESTPGEATRINMTPSSPTLSAGSSVTLTAQGYDEFSNKVDIDFSQADITVKNGTYADGKVTATAIGPVEVHAKLGKAEGTLHLACVDLAQLNANVDSINVPAGGHVTLAFTGLSTEGKTMDVNARNLTYEVVPASLGSVEGDVYTSNGSGNGYLKASYNGSINRYIPIYNNHATRVYSSLSKSSNVTATSYPDTVKAEVGINMDHSVDGDGSVKLSYDMNTSTETQAAYIQFHNAAIPEEAAAFSLHAKGTGFNHLLKARFIDSAENEHTVDFTNGIPGNFTKLSAPIPNAAVKPVRLDKIYVASLNEETDASYELYIDELGISVPDKSGKVDLPPSSTYRDTWKISPAELKEKGGASLTFKKDKGAHRVDNYAGITYVALSSSNGGIMKTAPAQWEALEKAINGDGQNIVVHLDQNPNRFALKEETNLFNNLMRKGVADGKNIIVIGNGSTNDHSIEAGVRYLTLNTSVGMKVVDGKLFYAFN